MRSKAFLLVVLGCALMSAAFAHAQEQTIIRSDENGEITLTKPAKVGDITLQPDTYVLQHRDSHGQDSIRFMRVERTQQLRISRAYTGWYTETELIKVGEIECRAEQVGTKAQTTMVTLATENGSLRIIKAMIKGKRAVYMF
jgi:hypothetical protein